MFETKLRTNINTITGRYGGRSATASAITRALGRNLALVAALMLAVTGVAQAADGTTRLSGVVNLNTADVEQLQMLPGVGEKRAAAIIDIRTSKGGFKSVDDLVEVKGVGESLLKRLRPHLSVSGKTTAKLL
jgi:comEA protein